MVSELFSQFYFSFSASSLCFYAAIVMGLAFAGYVFSYLRLYVGPIFGDYIGPGDRIRKETVKAGLLSAVFAFLSCVLVAYTEFQQAMFRARAFFTLYSLVIAFILLITVLTIIGRGPSDPWRADKRLYVQCRKIVRPILVCLILGIVMTWLLY